MGSSTRPAWRRLQAELFVFDFWYGPTVLTERPEVRVRRALRSDVHVTQIAEPDHHVNRNIVDVKYTLLAVDRKTARARAEHGGSLHAIFIISSGRSTFLRRRQDFKWSKQVEWLSRKSLDQRCWSGYVAALAIADRQ